MEEVFLTYQFWLGMGIAFLLSGAIVAIWTILGNER